MRCFKIGPACDRLDVLLYLVDRLTTLRLQHKSAARRAPPDSAEAHGHHAIQAAMKILVNSAYGYMGAGSMALFADRPAADEVTRQGREILGLVVDALRDRGMALLEADTDGVYFSAPLGWSEERERALVADVAAMLPDGIRLEYEGRFQAMLVHEVKNYALLTYGGELIVRGGALRSIRSELFGERFLQQALGSLLVGDIPALHRTYSETVSALRERRFTAMEVGTPARLSKSPEEYQTSRARMREAPYEAMLGAGHRKWRVGKRIRFYRAADGTIALLPEANDAPYGDTEGEEAQEIGTEGRSESRAERRDYDVTHYLQLFRTTYVDRLRKAFLPEDFNRLFRSSDQIGLFDQPIQMIEPLWIRCGEARSGPDGSPMCAATPELEPDPVPRQRP
jgi:DNA polymerase elongation subunit (family B)